MPGQGNIYEKSLWHVPGIVNELALWIDNNSWCIQPRLSVAASLAFLGSLVGRKVKDCYGNRTNLYIFGVAPSGTGKQAAIDGLKEAHHAIFSTPANRHQSEIIGPERWSSDTALVRDAGNRLNVIYLINEIGKILKSISNGAKTSAHLAGISTELLGLYDSAKGSFHGKAYADVRHEIATIHEPHVSIYGTTVRQSLIDSMTAETQQNKNSLTIQNRITAISLFSNWLANDGIELANVTLNELQTFIVWLRKEYRYRGKAITTSTIADYMVHLRMFYRYLHENRYILTNPAESLRLPKRPKKIHRDILDVNELKALLLQPDGNTASGMRDLMVLRVMAFSGLRANELCKLNLNHVNIKER